MSTLLAACQASHPVEPVTARSDPSAPLRVMSMNLCTDQLVLALLPPEQITSVSWISRDKQQSLMADKAAKVGVNYGLAEEVIDQKPDLVIAGTFTTPALRAMLSKLGYPLLEVGHATSLDDVRRITREIATAVDARDRAEKLIARMDAQFESLARNPAPPIRVVAWDRTGFSAGKGTLFDEILTAAGAVNLAREDMAQSYRRPDIEVLMKANPALLIQGTPNPQAASMGDDVARHRLVREYWSDRTVTVRQATYACGTPMVGEVALDLRDRLRGAAQHLEDKGPAVPVAKLAL